MRWLLAVLVAAGAFALPASAASVDPRLFVLHQVDVPARYFFDEDNSAIISRGMVLASPDEQARLLARSGFLAAYFARYLNSDPPRWRYVNSGAYVFRRAGGAKTWMEKLAREQGRGQTQRSKLDLGDEAWVLTSSSRRTGTSVVWRHRGVLAWVSCEQMVRHRTLALAQARKQQRRIAAAFG
jgi:hypothetical protein